MGRRGIALVVLGLGGGCRTADPERRPEGVVLSTPKAVRSEPFIQEVTAAPVELAGYTLAGPATCLPLAPGRACLIAKDELLQACAKAQGTVHRCENCQPLCDKEPVR